MLIIDLVENKKDILRYHAEHIPKIGDTISIFKPDMKTWKVFNVDRLIKTLDIQREDYIPYTLELITIEVKEIDA